MVSAIWNACSQGDVDLLQKLLKDATLADIEIKDQNGVTPLIEAIKNGHVEVVRILLDKGANPTNASSQALPEQYTSDPAIVKLLNAAKTSAHFHDLSDSERRFDTLPSGPYPYYPSISPSAPPPSMHDGAIYYPQPPLLSGEHQVPGGPPNLPPPEVARLIPCRFYPACRYGSSCLFAHPQGPYFSGPLPPPAQYPAPYDPILAQNFSHNYYTLPPPSFQPPTNGIQPRMSPTSPGGIHHTPPPMVHARSSSEMVSPPAHFSPPGGSPYGHMPPAFPHPGQVPLPLPIPAPPLHHQAAPQSPQSIYNNTSPTLPFVVRPDAASQYPPQPVKASQRYPELNGVPKSPHNLQNDSFSQGQAPAFRENVGSNRRGNPRRSSFAGRKPPCLFFPSGRCKNGDDCRFPHVMPDNTNSNSSYFSGRGGPRPRGNQANANGFGAIDEKLANMTVKDDSRAPNGVDGSSRSHSTDPGSRGRFSHTHGSKGGNHPVNATRAEKKAVVKQRVPNADDFPVLTGSTTPPGRSPAQASLTNGVVHPGPTAAQVLQAPAPLRKDSGKESSTRDGSPDPELVKEHRRREPNGVVIAESLTHSHSSCAATVTVAADIATEVAVSA